MIYQARKILTRRNMTKSATVKYTRHDQYGNPQFIASADIDEKSYNDLILSAQKLAELYPALYLPLYHSTDTETIKIKGELMGKLTRDAIYKIKWKCCPRTKSDGSKYPIIVIVGRPTLISKPDTDEEEHDI